MASLFDKLRRLVDTELDVLDAKHQGGHSLSDEQIRNLKILNDVAVTLEEHAPAEPPQQDSGDEDAPIEELLKVVK